MLSMKTLLIINIQLSLNFLLKKPIFKTLNKIRPVLIVFIYKNITLLSSFIIVHPNGIFFNKCT